MCITSEPSNMTGTFISSQAIGRNHRLIYQNETDTAVSNAMILPIPGRVKEIKSYPKSHVSNIYDLWEMYNTRSMEKGLNVSKVGSYIVARTLLLGSSSAKEFLEGYGISLKEELVKWFETNYEGWEYVICIFEPENGGSMHPVGIDYESFEWMSDMCFFPLVEAHGHVPTKNIVKPHQTCLVNNIPVLTPDTIVKTTNDDLYVKSDITTNNLRTLDQVTHEAFFEQNPKHLVFYT